MEDKHKEAEKVKIEKAKEWSRKRVIILVTFVIVLIIEALIFPDPLLVHIVTGFIYALIAGLLFKNRKK